MPATADLPARLLENAKLGCHARLTFLQAWINACPAFLCSTLVWIFLTILACFRVSERCPRSCIRFGCLEFPFVS
jgi:hypothetical protein